MEGIFRIISVGNVITRNYTDRNGQPALLTTRSIVLSNGVDTIAAEMTGDQAAKLDPSYYAAGSLVTAVLRFRVQHGKDGAMLFNSVTLVNLAKIE